MRGLLLLSLVALAALACVPAEAAFCHGKPDGGYANEHPIWDGEPKFVRSVANATLYQIGEGEDTIMLAHVFGDPYSMGYAYGAVLKDEITEFFPRVWKYFESQITGAIPDWIPAWLGEIIANEGLDAGLDATWLLTKEYTPSYVEPEQRGMSDATGVDYHMIRRVMLIGEITKGRCSMFGTWGNATADGGLLQLRALDWDVDGPLQDYPAVIVYHPDEGYGHPFANVGWAGWSGSLTGASSQQMGISEIGVTYPDDSFGEESLSGIPFVYLLRDILQFSGTLDDAISLMANSHRTCRLMLGVGDAKLGYFRGFQVSHSVMNVFDPLDAHPVADWHPVVSPNIFYWGMDWLCPSFSEKLASELSQYNGNITVENSIQQIIALTTTGDLHVALYDLTHQHMYVANARGSGETGPLEAFNRQYVHIDLNKAWAEPRPSSSSSSNHLVENSENDR